MVVRRIARVIYLLVFILVQQFTDLFTQYPSLGLIGLLGVLVVGLDALVCARRRWGSLQAALGQDKSTGN